MKVHILSNLSLQPVIQQLKKIADSNHEIMFEYVEDIISHLYMQQETVSKFDLLVIHTDFYFEQDPDKLSQLYSAVGKIARENVATKFAIPSQLEYFQYSSNSENTGLNTTFSKLFYAQTLNERSNVHVYDFQRKLVPIGLNQAYHFELGHLYQLPYKKPAIVGVAQTLKELIDTISIPEKKCIILDCDNTLWGGVVGEEGVDGIRVGLYAEGMFYYQFQKFIAYKKSQGFVLCLATKNNFDDIAEVFNKKTMPLALEDFVVVKANWEDKSNNIQEIASELNIGLDSLIFIDDSNFEIEFVNASLPQVTSIKTEENWDAFYTITNNPVFNRKQIVAEDQEKTALYKQNIQRQQAQSQVADRFSYIASLELKPIFKLNDLDNIERLSQLTEKTNQFNFNKVVFSVAQLKKWIEDGNFIISCNLSDKFGDYGIIGLMLVERKEEGAILENFLMSCRALGRGVEDTFWKFLIDTIQNEKRELKTIKLVNTPKNQPALEFYNTHINNGTNR